MTTTDAPVVLDTSEVDRHLGQRLGGGQLREPVSSTDIRRWVQGMQYPNPIHFDEDAARDGPFGRIVAPQSFAVCADTGHGATPAIVGAIPGTHMIFGGDEWWFYGPRIFPGDHLRQERWFHDYKVADTKFAGPTMFSRGDTLHRNQRGEPVAKQRSTAVRYLADEARKRGFFEQSAPIPSWTDARLLEIQAQRIDWIRSVRDAGKRSFDGVEVGQQLPTRPIGPHTIQSFATEWRAFIFQAWGAQVREGHDHIPEAGWLGEMDRNVEGSELDPGLDDGLYRGPSRGHVDIGHAKLIGMPRMYGYGAAMGAWILDYASGWAGPHGFVHHSNIQYRFPPFEGDLSVLDGTVVDKREDPTFDTALATVEVVMTNQDGTVMAKGPVEIQLPREQVTTFRGPPLEEEPGLGALTLPGLLEEVAARHRGREAVVFPADDIRLSYADLRAESRRLAKALLASGITKGARVGVLIANRPEWVVAAFGITMAGGVMVPLNTWFEPPELDFVLRHCDASLLLMQERLLHRDYVDDLRECGGPESFPALREVITVGQWDDLLARGDAVDDAALPDMAPLDDATIIYTSGSTAEPKGVLHHHQAAAIQSWRFAQHLRVDSTTRTWSAFPLFWTAGFAMIMGGTLAGGGCLVLTEHFEPGEALRVMEAERVTAAHAWPHQAGELEDHPDWASTDLSSLAHVEAFSSFGRHPKVHVDDVWSPRQAFGLTETFTIISSDPADTPRHGEELHAGHVLPGNAIRIVDPSTMAPLDTGGVGEIAVKGPTLMKGYVKASTPPFDDDGYFHTGDAGWVDGDNCLHWTGRTSDLIKTGGANVSPVEIETALLHHPDLKVAHAVGVPDDLLGELVVVCAVAHGGVAVTEDDVRGFLRRRLASYKIPRRVVFVSEDDLSLTANAKVRTSALRALAAAKLR